MLLAIVRAIEVTELNTAPDKDFIRQMNHLQEYFDDPPDTTLLMRGIRHASRLTQRLGLQRRFLELGAGISFPLTTAFKEGLVDEALAIELNNKAVLKGRDIAADMGVYDQKKYSIVQGDITDRRIQREAIAFHPTAIVANLPYLPEEKEVGDITRDAGADGTAFIKLQLQIAEQSNASLVSTNFSSLTTPEKLLPLFGEHGYKPQKLFVLIAPFGEQRTKYLLRKGVIRSEAGHLFYTDGTNPQQLMVNLVLVRNDIKIPLMNTYDIQTMMQNFSQSGRVSQINSLV